MLIWVLVPYSIDDGRLDGFDFDALPTKYEMAKVFRHLNLAWIWQPVVRSNLEAIVQQILESRELEDCVALNLCDGIDGRGTPGPCVVRALEQSGVAFTGANSEFYEISTSKLRMKEMFLAASVPTPAFEKLSGPVDGVCLRVGTPLLVKPDIAAASAGIFLRSKVSSDRDVAAMREELSRAPLPWFGDATTVFAERFIQGPEFTVFVMGDGRDPSSLRSLPAAERVFNASLPDGEKFLTFDRYWGEFAEEAEPPDGLPFVGYRACDPAVAPRVEEMARAAYVAVHGCGYARVDLRMEWSSGELFVLEVNANCELAEDDYTAIGSILKIAGMTFADLLRCIIGLASL